MKILTVLGARPQFVKAGSMSRVFARSSGIHEVIVHTGQHFDSNMSQIFFDEMEIPRPNYNLGISGGSHGEMTGRMLIEMDRVVKTELPDAVLVYGDTNSTLAGALVAVKQNIPIIHVEAGLRSFNNEMPEEINRVIVDRVSTILCCPSDVAVENLRREGIPNDKVFVVGDIMYDSVLYYSQRNEESRVNKWTGQDFLLATIHRSENVKNREKLESILKGLQNLSENTKIILPLHPGTAGYISQYDLTIPEGIQVIDPVGYLEMLDLIKASVAVITDSGGLQKEAYFLKRPCLTLRNETEWVETVEVGCNFLVGTDFKKIISGYENLTNKNFDFNQNLYGDGSSADKICQIILNMKT